MVAAHTERERFRERASFAGVSSRTKPLKRAKTHFRLDIEQFILNETVKVTQHSSIASQDI